MKDFFKPEDFCKDDWTAKFSDEMAKIANEKLQQWIKNLPIIYGNVGKISSSWHSEKPGTYVQENYTHTARLIDIKELPKQECKHEPDLLKMFQEYGLQNSKCKHCGIELRVTWSPK